MEGTVPQTSVLDRSEIERLANEGVDFAEYMRGGGKVGKERERGRSERRGEVLGYERRKVLVLRPVKG